MYEISFKESGDNCGEIVIKVGDNAYRHFYGSFDKMLHISDELARAYEAGMKDERAGKL